MSLRSFRVDVSECVRGRRSDMHRGTPSTYTDTKETNDRPLSPVQMLFQVDADATRMATASGCSEPAGRRALHTLRPLSVPPCMARLQLPVAGCSRKPTSAQPSSLTNHHPQQWGHPAIMCVTGSSVVLRAKVRLGGTK